MLRRGCSVLSNVCACGEDCCNKEKVFEEIDENLDAEENVESDVLESTIDDDVYPGDPDRDHLEKRQRFE